MSSATNQPAVKGKGKSSQQTNFLAEWYSSEEEMSRGFTLKELSDAVGGIRLLRGRRQHVVQNSKGEPILFMSNALIPEPLRIPEQAESSQMRAYKTIEVLKALKSSKVRVMRMEQLPEGEDFKKVVGVLIEDFNLTGIDASAYL